MECNWQWKHFCRIKVGKKKTETVEQSVVLISKRMSVFSAREKFGEHVRDVKAVGGDIMAECNRPFRKIPQYSLFVPHKHCFCFLYGPCKSQEKLETMLMQNLGGQTRSIMVFSEVVYCFPNFQSRVGSG